MAYVYVLIHRHLSVPLFYSLYTQLVYEKPGKNRMNTQTVFYSWHSWARKVNLTKGQAICSEFYLIKQEK